MMIIVVIMATLAESNKQPLITSDVYVNDNAALIGGGYELNSYKPIDLFLK